MRIRRLLLWTTPIALTATLGIALGCAVGEARLDESAAHLAAGNAHAAAVAVLPLADKPIYGDAAREALRVARAMAGQEPVAQANGPIDEERFPIAVLTRNAFERGDFQAALALDDLAHATGQPTAPLVRAAALIEEGRVHELPSEPWKTGGGELSQRVRQYLDGVSEHAYRTIVRDRNGVFIGYLGADGVLELAPGVPEAVIPRNTARLVQQQSGAPSIRLSLDLELSLAAYETFGYYHGSIVLVDPKTGEILAAVSDPRSFKRASGTPAFEQQREPASISKIITTTAFRRSGEDPDAEISEMYCRGHGRYAGELLYCAYVARSLHGLDRALALSCNFAFAELGVKAGRRHVVDELRRYGFDNQEWNFPAGRIVQAWGDDRQLADMSVGLEATEITPLHAAMVATVMANDGVMPRPTLLHAEDSRLGLHPRPVAHESGHRVIPPEWVPEMLQAMEAVVDRGTGRNLAPRNFPIAMKTGTASHPRYAFHVNYIGIGPLPEARVAFAVRITDQPTSRKVRYAAKRVTRRLLERLGDISDQRGWNTEQRSPRFQRPTSSLSSVAP